MRRHRRPLVVAFTSLLAMGIAACGDSSDPQASTQPISAATEAWWAYTRPASYGVLAQPVDVPMRDGVTLGCTLSRPTTNGALAGGRFPGLVIEFTPYAAIGAVYEAEADYFVSRGYNGLVCTLRGTGRSGGVWQHAMSSQDGRDAHDLVEWLAAQPFSDGRIGQFGESYGGATSYGAAVERAPHLRAIAPLQPPGDLYRDVVYPGGIKATERGSLDNWPPTAQGLSFGGVDAAAEYAVNRAHPTYDDYWQDHSLRGRHGAIEVPVLTVGGWRDGYFRAGTLANIEALPERTWTIYGPWEHGIVVAFCDCPADGLVPGGVLLAWFDHWVMELPDVPIPPHPTFVSFEGPVGVGDGWREISDWDPHGSGGVTMNLGAVGELGNTIVGGSVLFREPPSSAAVASATFTSAPLATDQVLLGHPTLTLEASLDAADAHFYVELLDVNPEGSETFVNDGYLAASHRTSHVDPEPVAHDVVIEYAIPIRPQHYRFAAGQRVRLRISGGPPELLNPPADPVEVHIHTGHSSHLRLPGFSN